MRERGGAGKGGRVRVCGIRVRLVARCCDARGGERMAPGKKRECGMGVVGVCEMCVEGVCGLGWRAGGRMDGRTEG
eukprot:357169-Chlamydomonas_euryale.AAC.1